MKREDAERRWRERHARNRGPNPEPKEPKQKRGGWAAPAPSWGWVQSRGVHKKPKKPPSKTAMKRREREAARKLIADSMQRLGESLRALSEEPGLPKP